MTAGSTEQSVHDDLTRIGSDLWIVCEPGGKVAAASASAVRAGMSVGSAGADTVISRVRADFEDALQICRDGGDVSLLLPAVPVVDAALAHLKSVELFSSSALKITFYKSKSEYLAAGIAGNRMSAACRSGTAIEQFLSSFTDVRASEDALNVLKLISSLPSGIGNTDPPEWEDYDSTGASYDASALFNIIDDGFSEAMPFSANFENSVTDPTLCRDPYDRFVGIVLMSAAVCARLSADKTCGISLTNDGESFGVSASCILRSKHPGGFCGSDLGRLYGLIPATPVELMALEYLTVSGWDVRFECRGKDFTLCVNRPLCNDIDRLKFRYSPAGSGELISSYLAYMSTAFSSESQQ